MLPTPKTLRHHQYFLPETSTELDESVRTHYQDWQEYHLRLTRLHHGYLHGWGIVSGLQVSQHPENAHELVVSSGLAIDRHGRLITLGDEEGEFAVFGEDQDKLLPPYRFDVSDKQSTSIYLTIRLFRQLNNSDQAEYLAWLQLTPTTDVNEALTGGDALLLAIVDVDADGNIATLRDADPLYPHARRLIDSRSASLELLRSETRDNTAVNVVAGHLRATETGLQLQVANASDELLVLGPDGDPLSRLGVRGALEIHDGAGTPLVTVTHDPVNGAGHLWLSGADGALRTELTSAGVHTTGLLTGDGGASLRQGLTIRNADDSSALTATPGSTGACRLDIWRPDQTPGVVVGTEGSGEAEQGALTLYNAGGAGTWLTSAGMGTNGSIFARNGIATNGSLTVGQNVTVSGALITTGPLTAQSNLSVQGSLAVTGPITSQQPIETQNLFLSRSGMDIRDGSGSTTGFFRSSGIGIRGGYHVLDNEDNSLAWFNSGGMVARGGLTIRDSNNKNIAWFNSSWVTVRGGLTIRDSNDNNLAWFSSGGLVARGGLTIQDTSGSSIAWFGSGSAVTRGSISVRNADNQTLVTMSTTTNDDGFFQLYRKDGKPLVRLTTTGDTSNKRGTISVYNGTEDVVARVTTTDDNGGRIKIYRKDGSGLVVLTSTGNGTRGYLGVYNQSNDQVVQAFAGSSGHGFIGVKKNGSNSWAHWLDANGSKNFIVEHPTEPSKDIVYAAIEGPEAAAYCRGQAKLEQGKAFVAYPEHFALVVNPETVTIHLTPRAVDSKGLAVIGNSAKGFDVQELADGDGSYEFDYFVAGVRKGLEHYQPVVERGYTAFGEYIGDANDELEATRMGDVQIMTSTEDLEASDDIATPPVAPQPDPPLVVEPRVTEPTVTDRLPDVQPRTESSIMADQNQQPGIAKPPHMNQ